MEPFWNYYTSNLNSCFNQRILMKEYLLLFQFNVKGDYLPVFWVDYKIFCAVKIRFTDTFWHYQGSNKQLFSKRNFIHIFWRIKNLQIEFCNFFFLILIIYICEYINFLLGNKLFKINWNKLMKQALICQNIFVFSVIYCNLFFIVI